MSYNIEIYFVFRRVSENKKPEHSQYELLRFYHFYIEGFITVYSSN